jgi:RNA polymerase sigma factor (TIGR02999 family)
VAVEPVPAPNPSEAPTAADLLPLVYEELRAIAAEHLRRERAGHTLQPTALVHEAWLKLADQSGARWQNRTHFLAVASHALRRVLVDHARKHKALKRGRGRPPTIALEEDVCPLPEPQVDLLSMDEALGRLAALDQRKARVVELRFFAGLTLDETAEALGVARTTVEGDWRVARAWLRAELTRGSAS